ncbi:MAG: hypothetical protein RSA10_00920 [Bacilli bacterium]
MSKLLKNVLEKVCENNNEYRKELRNLNSTIDSKTTALVGELVTISNYKLDFSNTTVLAKENLTNPILRIIESYVIKDLRSVEGVNEQFVEKINDKIENARITTSDEKDNFIDNLYNLLNNKYLEIVKIKRIDFFNEYGVNEEIEEKINDFIKALTNSNNLDSAQMINNFSLYKKELYQSISATLNVISKLYLDNFVNEVGSSLNSAVDFDEETPMLKLNDNINFNVIRENEVELKPFLPEVEEIKIEEASPMIVEPTVELKTFAFEEDSPKEKLEEVLPETEKIIRPAYDVEEILKIAKSPVLNIEPKVKDNDGYTPIVPITLKEEKETLLSDINEKELVEEIIMRLSKRLSTIDERQTNFDIHENQLKEDDAFVNDLITSAESKKAELDRFEAGLDEKEQELNKKEQELKDKLNVIMPFANAVLQVEKQEF